MRLFVNLALGATAFLLACGGEAPGPAADESPRPYATEAAPYAEAVRSSHYVVMRDGVRLAVDVTLPAGLPDSERVPALLEQNRYWRGVQLRWPLGAVFEPPDAAAEFFARRGVAYVSVDVRGSGASFGAWSHPWSRVELRDAIEIVDWIVGQPWSNGRVAAEGASYSGTAAELLLASGHPAVRAIAPRFALFDAYTDIAFPGGLPLSGLLDVWSRANRGLDGGVLPSRAGVLPRLLVSGPRPVNGSRKLLEQAIRDHAANGDVRKIIGDRIHRDDRSSVNELGVDDMSPRARREELVATGVPIYSWSGWFDGALPRAAIRRYLSVRTPGSRLLIGPWNHGGDHSASPTSAGPAGFDANAELLRFLDPALRGIDSGIGDDAPIYYFTMVEDRWKAARGWPPPSEPQRWFFAEDGRLHREAPGTGEATDRYRVDPGVGTGDLSRWDTVMGDLPVVYGDRAAMDRRLLTYTSAPLQAPIEVTGHPVVDLHVASSAEDGAFLVYLEDVAPDGVVHYVTEGMLRALHRALSNEPDPLAGIVPLHSFRRADARALVPGEVTRLQFDLLPVSYLFRPGHRIRLALAGADRDHFVAIPDGQPPTWHVHRDREHASHVVLPVATLASAQSSPTSPER